MLRPRAVQEAATSSLATVAEAGQPIVIEDDDDAQRTGASASSVAATTSATATLKTKRSSMLKAPPTARPKVLLKRPPVKGSTSCGKVCCSEGTSGAPLQHLGLPCSIARVCIITSFFASNYLGTGYTTCSSLVLPSTETSKPMPKGPPAAPKPKAPSREQVQILGTDMTGRPGHRTMEMIGGSSAPSSLVPLAFPCFALRLMGLETMNVLDCQGRAGIISIARWNLHPVIFGVED